MSLISLDDSNKLQIPLLPLRDVVVFPYMIAPLYIGRDKSIKAVNAAMKNKKEIFLVTQKDPKNEDPKESDLFTIGTIATVAQMLKLPILFQNLNIFSFMLSQLKKKRFQISKQKHLLGICYQHLKAM
jgi:ATP-dependent Lon protease